MFTTISRIYQHVPHLPKCLTPGRINDTQPCLLQFHCQLCQSENSLCALFLFESWLASTFSASHDWKADLFTLALLPSMAQLKHGPTCTSHIKPDISKRQRGKSPVRTIWISQESSSDKLVFMHSSCFTWQVAKPRF